jgi:preprotein translocase subunit SecF
MRLLANANFNFIRWRWHAIVLSVAIIAIGTFTMVRRGGLSLGVDFTGGTVLVVQFQQRVGEDTVREALRPVAGDPLVQQFGPASDNQIMVRLPRVEGQDEGLALEQNATKVREALTGAAVGPFEVISTEVVGPVIGDDLQRRGIFATMASLLGIMAYIAFRFRIGFAVGAIVASIHDILVTLSLLALAQYELSLNVVAAILALTGYGVNDQIVVFDRVREKLRTMRRDAMDVVINRAVNETLPRTIITAGTAFLAVLALFLFGGEVLRGFAFAMLVGIVSSTYSTVYIASAVAVLLSPRRDTTVASASAAAKGPRPGKKAVRRT